MDNNSNKQSYNDNFSEFLNEYKNKTENKKQWVDDSLNIVDKTIESIQNEAPAKLKTNLNIPRQTIRNADIDSNQKVVFSIRELSDIFSKEEIPTDLLTKMSAFKRILNIYINIAKFTSDEIIAKEVINLGSVLENKFPKK